MTAPTFVTRPTDAGDVNERGPFASAPATQDEASRVAAVGGDLGVGREPGEGRGLGGALLGGYVTGGAPVARAAALLAHLADGEAGGPWGNIEEEDVTVPASRERVRARSYRPAGAGARSSLPGLVLAHGLSPDGIDDPRLVRFARALAGAGLEVLTPELQALIEPRVDPRCLGTLGAAVKMLAAQTGCPVGLVGLSLAGGLALLAAADPRLAEPIGYLVCIGAHHDLGRVCRHLLANPEGARRVKGFADVTPEALAAVSPRGQLDRVGAPVFLLHGANDPVIPATESRRIARELRPGTLRASLVTPALSHVDFGGSGVTAEEARALVNFLAGVLEEADGSRGEAGDALGGSEGASEPGALDRLGSALGDAARRLNPFGHPMPLRSVPLPPTPSEDWVPEPYAPPDPEYPTLIPPANPAWEEPAPREEPRKPLTRRVYTVKKDDGMRRIAKGFAAATRPHWYRELVRANPHKRLDGDRGWTSLGAGEVINIPDAWPERMGTATDPLRSRSAAAETGDPGESGAPPATTSNADRGAKQIAALQAISRDPSSVHALSGPGQVVLAALTGVVEKVGGLALDAIKTEVTTSLLPTIADMLGTTVSDLASAIPMVGQVVALGIKVVTALASAGSSNEASVQGLCRACQQRFQPLPTGSILAGDGMVPADIFAPVHRVYDTYAPETQRTVRALGNKVYGAHNKWNPLSSGPCIGVEGYASTLGQALTLLLEGASVDSADVEWGRLHHAGGWGLRGLVRLDYLREAMGNAPLPHNVASFERLIAANIAHCDREWRRAHPTRAQLGPTPARRAQYRALRRAIRASYVPSLGRGAQSDGGAGLWTLYLDLLRDDFARGHFPAGYATDALYRRQWVYVPRHMPFAAPTLMFGDSGDYTTPLQGNQTCAALAYSQIEAIVQTWGRAVDPRYQTGQTKLAELKAQAIAIGQARVAAHPGARPAPARAASIRRSPPTDPFASLARAPASAVSSRATDPFRPLQKATDTGDPLDDVPGAIHMRSIVDVFDAGDALFAWRPITVTHKWHPRDPGLLATFWVFVDALRDRVTGLRWPCSAAESQIVADRILVAPKDIPQWWGMRSAEQLPCLMMTPRLMAARWLHARQSHEIIPPHPQNTEDLLLATVTRMTAAIDRELARLRPRDPWVADPGKIWGLDRRLFDGTATAINYGEHVDPVLTPAPVRLSTNGAIPGISLIQSIGDRHGPDHIDYSQILLLVAPWCMVAGEGHDQMLPMKTADVYTSGELAGLVTDDAKPLAGVRQPFDPAQVAPARIWFWKQQAGIWRQKQRLGLGVLDPLPPGALALGGRPS